VVNDTRSETSTTRYRLARQTISEDTADHTVWLTTGDRINILVPAIRDNNVDSTAIDTSNPPATGNPGEAGRQTR